MRTSIVSRVGSQGGVGRIAFFALVLTVSAAGCGDRGLTSVAEHYGAILVQATDDVGSPVPGLRVDVHGPGRRMGTAITGIDGTHRFDYIPAATFHLALYPPPGYALPHDHPNPLPDIVIERGQSVAVPVLLTTRFGGIQLLVLENGTGSPVAGVVLELASSVREIAAVSTNQDGVAIFSEVPIGSYFLRIRSPASLEPAATEPNGFENVVVREGETTNVTLVVQTVSPIE